MNVNLLYSDYRQVLATHAVILRVVRTRTKLKTKLRGFSPRANHTDRAAAAGRQS